MIDRAQHNRSIINGKKEVKYREVFESLSWIGILGHNKAFVRDRLLKVLKYMEIKSNENYKKSSAQHKMRGLLRK